MLAQLSLGFWHENGQRFSNQLCRGITKDSGSCRIRKKNRTTLVSANHSITGCFYDEAISRFAAFALRLGSLALFDVCRDSVPLQNISLLIPQRHSTNQEPAIFPVC